MNRIIFYLSSTLLYIILFLTFTPFVLSGQTDETENKLPNFLFNAFTKGMVRLKTGETYSAVLNYNIVNEEMIFEQRGKYLALLEPEKLDTVYIQNRKFIPVGKAFYEIVAPGKVPIFIQNKGRLTTVGSNTAYGLKSQTLGPTSVKTMQSGNQVRDIALPDNITVSPASVNWVRINGEYMKFTGERQLLKIFPGRENELKEFLRQNNIDLKNRQDIQKLGRFLNSIN